MFCVANAGERRSALWVALGTGLFLAAGFLPVSQGIVDSAIAPFLPGRARVLAWLGCLAFPALALAFHLSIPRPVRPESRELPFWSFPLPLAIGLAYGLWDPAPGIFSLVRSPETQLAAVWAILLAPLGEEWLFRGWLYSLAYRLWPGRFASATNPLPLAVWVTAIAFSLWHLQNWGAEPAARVLWQTAYTLPAGLWLGWLRWRSGGMALPILAHIGLNAATALA